MSLSQHAIRRPFGYFLVIALASLVGMVSVYTMPIRYLPELGHDQVATTLTLRGYALEETQRLVTEPVEEVLMSVPGVDGVRTVTTAGLVQVVLELDDPAVSEAVKSDVRDRLSRLQANLTPKFEVEAVLSRSSRDAEMSRIAVSGGDPTEMAKANDELRERLLRLDGVDRVEVDGLLRQELVVLPDQAKLLMAGLTQTELAERIAANAEGDKGFVIGRPEAPANLVLEGTVEGADVDRLARLPIKLPLGGMMALAELARIEMRTVPVEGHVTVDGVAAVLFSVYANPSADLATLSDAIDRATNQFEGDTGIAATVVDRRADTVLNTAKSTFLTFLEGILLVMVIVWVSLRAARSVALAGIVVPLTVLPSLFVMQVCGFSLNIISMMALVLAVGIVIDDAIVELENIHRHLGRGESSRAATQKATRRIGRAVIATTMSVVAVFLPVTVLPGMAGRYFQEFGGTFVIAALVSLFVVRTILPPLAARFAKPSVDQAGSGSSRLLARALDMGFKHPVLCIAAAGVLVAVSLLGVVRQTGDFIPADDTGRILVALELPVGDETVAARTMRIVRDLSQLEGVKHAYAIGGRGDDLIASLVLVLDPQRERALSQHQIEALATENLLLEPALRFRILTSTGRPGAEIALQSDDRDVLQLEAEQLVTALREDPVLRDVAIEGYDRFETSLAVDPVSLQSLGIDPSKVSASLALLADTAEPLAILLGDTGEPVPLRIGLPAANSLSSSLIRTASGDIVPLGTVVGRGLSIMQNEIVREDGSFVLRVSADRAGTASAKDVRNAWRRGLEVEGVAESRNVSVVSAGDQKQREKMVKAFNIAAMVGLIVLAATLYALFRSTLDVIVIMVSLPFAIGGAAVGLALSGQGLSLPALLAFLLLLGIVAKNAILILDEARTQMNNGCEPKTALRSAALLRSKAVIMTSAAVICGMAPAMFGLGEGAGFRQPMAIAVSSGIAVSTFTSLILVPVLASAFHGVAAYVMRSLTALRFAEG